MAESQSPICPFWHPDTGHPMTLADHTPQQYAYCERRFKEHYGRDALAAPATEKDGGGG